MTTAAGIIIGDEILSGKVEDRNAGRLIQTLHRVGVELKRLSTIGDDLEVIAEEVNRCRTFHDHVITSGGVGPTHDDRTMEGVALAFSVDLVVHPVLERLVRDHWKDRVNDAALKLAAIPDGAVLISSEDAFPLVAMDNVHILPGIPELFAKKLARLEREFCGHPALLHSVYLDADESSFAELLATIEAEHPRVKVGSYPRLTSRGHRVRVTLESRVVTAADAALERLLLKLPADQVVRVERGLARPSED